MEIVPAALIRSLNGLGLSNYEAGVYAALILHDNAEAKEIVEFLSISKPTVYEALDQLADMGLAVKNISKPARYSAISPDMAIELLMDRHREAADLALIALKKLGSRKVKNDREDALWTIYGDANIEYKIRDLFRKAKRYISCTIGERYLPYVGSMKIGDVPLRLVVISDNPGILTKLHETFPGKNAEIHIVSGRKFHEPPPFAPPEYAEAAKFMNFENTLQLIVDDEEILMIPPFISGSVSVLNTRNKGAILQMKMFGEMHIRRLLGEENPGPGPAVRAEKPVKARKIRKSVP